MPAAASEYEHVIIGAGVSGLTLAYFLADALPSTTPILLVDKDDDPNYNISFWSERDTPFAPVMEHVWRTIAVRHGNRETVCPLSRYRLKAFWRDDFDAFLHEQLGRHPNVQFLDASVSEVVERGDRAEVRTSAGTLRAGWAFDSRASVYALQCDDPSLMLMQGLAVEVECEAPCFDPEVATLFDFLLDTPELDFMYVLPHSERYALVNVAFVTPNDTSVTRETCQQVIDGYITERIGCTRYEVKKHCYGRIPLASKFPKRRPGSRVMPIGVRSGMIKASTSYAFTRILTDSQRIAAALRDTGQPYSPRRRPRYYRWMDKRTSRVFHSSPKLAQELMFTMFTPTTGDLALSFLDEKNSLSDNRQLFQAIPPETLKRFLWRLAAAALPGGA